MALIRTEETHTSSKHSILRINLIIPTRPLHVDIPRLSSRRASDPHEEGVDDQKNVYGGHTEPKEVFGPSTRQQPEQREGERGLAPYRGEDGEGANEVADQTDGGQVFFGDGLNMFAETFGGSDGD